MPREQWATGNTFEELLDYTHNIFWNRERWWVRHNGIEGVWRSDHRGGRKFTPISKMAAPDYYGCIDGRFIAFDAKSTKNKTYWRLHNDAEHQYRYLQDLDEAGAVAFFLVEERRKDRVHLLRIRHNINDWPRIVFKESERYETSFNLVVPFDGGLYPYLTAVKEQWLAT